MRLVGADANPAVMGADVLPGKVNYFIGNDPKKWRTNVPTYAKVKYQGVYPGIDLVYYGNQGGQLEYDFVVAPGADPSVIALDVAAGLPRHVEITLDKIVLCTTGDFAVSTTPCGSSLAAKSKCTISVTFTPTATGTRTGSLNVTDSALNSPQTAALTGTGE
jgi:hypothetical protein